MAITYQDIEKACEDVMSKGMSVTQRSIRNELGYGSMTTISNLLKEWKNINVSKIEHVSKRIDTKRCDTYSASRVRSKNTVKSFERNTDNEMSLIANAKGAGVNSKLFNTRNVSKCSFENVIQFPDITTLGSESNVLNTRIAQLEKENGILREELSKDRTLTSIWGQCLRETFSPHRLGFITGYTCKLACVLIFITAAIWLSVHISGDFFGQKGFETALGVLLGGGVLSFLARASQSHLKAFFFRLLAYIGTLGFLLVAFSGIKDSAIKENEAYISSKKKISFLETQITAISTTISSLPVEFSKVRDKEYIRQDILQKELDAERRNLAAITPGITSDLSVVGHFIARFIMDVLVFALFEVLAGMMIRRKS